MTDIVIPTAREPRNWCLPYALDSIARHTNYSPVTIGFNPRSAARHIDSAQTGDRFANTDEAVRLACTRDDISDPFILSADDIYWLHPAEPQRWALGHLGDATGATVYAQRKRDTADLLSHLGLPTWDYETHTPLLIHKAHMLHALTIGGDKRSVYGNLTGQPDHTGTDVKMRNPRDTIPDAPWASTAHTPTRYPHLMQALHRRG